MQHTSIIPVLKKKKPCHNFGTIYIRGFFNNKPVAAISTGHKVLIKNWDIENRRLSDKAPNAKLINTCIEMKLQQMHAQLMKLEIMGSNINRRHINAAVKGQNLASDFLKFCTENIVKKYINKETLRTYNSEVSKLQNFKTDISFADIDYDFLTNYKAFMRDKLKNADNTIWKSFKFLRTMTKDALKQKGYFNQDPFEEFDRGMYVQTNRTYLTIDECERIYAIALNEDAVVIMRRVALYFLLMCYSGLRYEDAISFNPDAHIIENERLVRKTSKGRGEIINIKLYGRLRQVVDLIRQQPLHISNQEFNRWLKLITIQARIAKTITCHVGRHTFGSFLVDAGAPKEAAQKLLGHADMRSTNVYYHVKEKNVDDAASKLNAL